LPHATPAALTTGGYGLTAVAADLRTGGSAPCSVTV